MKFNGYSIEHGEEHALKGVSPVEVFPMDKPQDGFDSWAYIASEGLTIAQQLAVDGCDREPDTQGMILIAVPVNAYEELT